MGESEEKISWKRRFMREFIRYWINVLYLSFVFGVFTWYRRLILAHYEVKYLDYGVAIIEALILAKVVLIADALGLARKRFKDSPLIYPTVYKSIMFALMVGVFAMLEATIKGLFKGEGWHGWIVELHDVGKYEFMARCLMVFVVFIPFFAFKELSGILGGEGKLGRLFFRNRHALAG